MIKTGNNDRRDSYCLQSPIKIVFFAVINNYIHYIHDAIKPSQSSPT